MHRKETRWVQFLRKVPENKKVLTEVDILSK